MCRDCEKNMANITSHIAKLDGHISGLVDGLDVGTNEAWEKLEILTFGGTNGTYAIHAPFTSACQYSVQNISSSTNAVICISPKAVPTTVVSFTVNPQNYSEMNGFNGFIFNVSATQTPVPVMSEWTDVSNSFNELYMRIDITASNASYVAIAFKQKRIVKR
jgi:hypothetical protein